MRRWLPAAALALAAAGCDDAVEIAAPEPPLERGAAWVASPEARRDALVASLVNPDNGYSARRIAKYTPEAWAGLPEWRPRVRPVRASDLGGPVPEVDDTWAALDTDVPWTDEALTALGARAFTDYPNQVEPALVTALADADAPARYGLWVAEGRVGGLVWVALPDGVQPAFTCSSCHARVDDGGALQPGAPNHGFDYGALLDAHRGVPTSAGRWGPGRVDVTPDGEDNPTVIADLRAVSFQRRYNRAATIEADLLALSSRVETAFIVASGQAVRPPPELAFALSWYLWGLGDATPPPAEDTEGAAVFEARCAACHVPPGLAGPPIALDLIGTDPTVGASPWRETGAYQTPSLRGVASRGRLMAGGDVGSLAEAVDPTRDAPGHRFTEGLTDAQRAALLEHLEALE